MSFSAPKRQGWPDQPGLNPSPVRCGPDQRWLSCSAQRCLRGDRLSLRKAPTQRIERRTWQDSAAARPFNQIPTSTDKDIRSRILPTSLLHGRSSYAISWYTRRVAHAEIPICHSHVRCSSTRNILSQALDSLYATQHQMSIFKCIQCFSHPIQRFKATCVHICKA